MLSLRVECEGVETFVGETGSVDVDVVVVVVDVDEVGDDNDVDTGVDIGVDTLRVNVVVVRESFECVEQVHEPLNWEQLPSECKSSSSKGVLVPTSDRPPPPPLTQFD